MLSVGDIRPVIPGGIDYPLPGLAPVQQRFPPDKVDNVRGALDDGLAALTGLNLRGKRIAVTAGSRHIAGDLDIYEGLICFLKDRGAEPFIVPAMGSHGNADADGQRQVLARYGVTPERIGAPVEASMEVVEIDRLEGGPPLYCDRLAAEADGIVLFNKIKPHAGFKGEHESGLLKMLVVGLGKHMGANTIHRQGIWTFSDLIPKAGATLLAKLPVLFAVGVVENAYDQPAEVNVVAKEAIIAGAAAMLRRAKHVMGRLLPPKIDVLIIDEVGKDFNGASLDPNVTGRPASGLPGFEAPAIQRIVVRALSRLTHGNAIGIGVADIVTRRCAEAIDLSATYTNGITAAISGGVKLPMILNNDREALVVAARMTVGTTPETLRVVRIANTRDLSQIAVSEACLADMAGRDDFHVLGPTVPVTFDAEGYLDDGGN